MNKTTFVLLLFLLSFFSGRSQLVENFDASTVAAPAPGDATWTLPSGTWQILDNNVGDIDWTLNPQSSYPAYSGSKAAFINREEIGQGNTSRDYLVTPLVSIPENAQLRFQTRTTLSTNYGTIFEIRSAPAGSNPADIESYTTLLASWSENTLLADYQTYEEKIVDLPYETAGTDMYIAFVKVFTQNGNTISGERWLVDDVKVISACYAPQYPTAAPSPTTALLSWYSEGVTSWNVHVLPHIVPFIPSNLGDPIVADTSSGIVVTQTTQPTPADLVPLAGYKYYVQAVCEDSTSEWAEYEFYTQATPPECGGIFTDPNGPTTDYSNNTNYSVTICPEEEGGIVQVSFTSFQTYPQYDGMYIYDGDSSSAPQFNSGNPAGFTPALSTSGAYWGEVNPGSFESTSASGCLTFVFSSADWTSGYGTAGWQATVACLPAPACHKVTAMSLGATTQDTIEVNWTAVGSATEWMVYAVPCGLAVPTIETEGGQLATASPYILTGLSSITCYDVYVISVCSETENSTPAGPKTAYTEVTEPICSGMFVDPAGPGNYANNENSIVTICPQTAGDILTVTFTQFETEENRDGMYVYNGDTTSAPLFPSANGAGWNASLSTPGAYWGTTIPGPFESANPTGCLTFRFTSDAYTTYAGWQANVTCAPPPTCPKPTALTLGIPTDTTVDVSWTPGGTETAWMVYVVPCNSQIPTIETEGGQLASASPYTYTGLDPISCYNFYVIAVCSSTDASIASAPKTTTTQVAAPVCGGTYTDPAGPADYAAGTDSIVTVCPEVEGEVVTVTFTSFDIVPLDGGIYVYDGASTSSPLVSSGNPNGYGVQLQQPGAYWGTESPGVVESTSPDGCLTFHFVALPNVGTEGYSGFDANVTCGPASTCFKPTALTVGVPTDEVEVSWAYTGPATSWMVYALPCGSPIPTNETTGGELATVSPYIFTGLNPLSCYDIYVISICSDGDASNAAGPQTITTPVTPPVCGGIFTDAGGADGDYPYSGGWTVVTICPEVAGEVVTVSFTEFSTYPQQAGLYVYDGNSTTSPLIPSNRPAGDAFQLSTPGSYWGIDSPGIVESTSTDGCLTFSFYGDGFVDDGWVADVSCGPPSTCAKPTAVILGTPTGNSVQVNWTGTAAEYMVFALPCGSDIPTIDTVGGQLAPASPYTVTGLQGLTCYQIYVIAVCSETGSSHSTGPYSVTTQVTPPVCGGVFTDAGGPSADYPSGFTDSIVTICPDEEGDVVNVVFTSFSVSPQYDGMYVFDGNSITSPLLPSSNPAGFFYMLNTPGAYWGNNNPGPFQSTSVDGCLTFHFVTNAYATEAGWQANVTCVPAPTCAKPTTLTLSNSTDTSVDVSWTQPDTATNWMVYAVQCGAAAPTLGSAGGQEATTSPYTYTGLQALTCYDFYVIAICSDTDSSMAAGPKSASTQVVPPGCGEIFTDIGGATANYPNINSTVIICPEIEGEIVTVSFTEFSVQENYQGLYVHDGDSTAAPILASENGAGGLSASGAFWGTDNPGTFQATSDSGCLTFEFIAEGGWSALPGWQATVDCGPPPTCMRPSQLVLEPVFTTIEASWIPEGAATEWILFAVPCGTTAPTIESEGGLIATSSPYTIADLDPLSCYDVYIFAICSQTDSSIAIGPKSATTGIPEPACGEVFTDPGGVGSFEAGGGYYWGGIDEITVICPDNPGDVVTVNFTQFEVSDFFDGLYIYDGDSTSSPQISSDNGAGYWDGLSTPGAFWGYTSLPGSFTSTSPTGCLTFHFISVDWSSNWSGWLADVSCETPPTCPTPIEITFTNPTENSVTVEWVEIGSATEWQVLVLPYDQGVPDGNATGWQTAITQSFVYEGLSPAGHYKVYVRAICTEDDSSDWSNPDSFYTPLTNDECVGATFLTVNGDANCAQTTSGHFIGATDSGISNCAGTANDDVWFQFTAVETMHSISVYTDVDPWVAGALYSGECGELVFINCFEHLVTGGAIMDGLILGQVYFIQLYSYDTASSSLFFDVCIGTPPPPISVDADYTPSALVEQVLFNTPCMSVSNITSSTGSDFGSVDGIGYFNQNGSDFPFEEGVVLSTCSVSHTVGPNNHMLSEGAYGGSWPGDSQAADFFYASTGIEEAASSNASKIEFDFVPSTTSMSFRYVFASDGYGYAQCFTFNTFAFILQDVTENGPFENFAVLPDTALPVSEFTVRNQSFNPDFFGCQSANEEYFGAYYGMYGPSDGYLPDGGMQPMSNPTNFNGLTVPLTAVATVIPGHTYHVKLVLTDVFSSKYDAAVFIEGFNLGEVGLGEDVTICDGGSYTIATGLDAEEYSFVWTKDGETQGETGASITVTESGLYNVSATLTETNCVTTDEINIMVLDPIDLAEIDDITQCVAFTFPAPAVGHFYAEANGQGAILDNTTISAIGTTSVYLYASNELDCFEEETFTVTITVPDVLAEIADVTSCGTYTLPTIEGVAYYNVTGATGTAITSVTASQTVYAYKAGATADCFAEESFTVTITTEPVLADIQDVVSCGTYALPAIAGVTYYNATGATGGAISSVTTTQQVYANMAGSTPECSAEKSFTVTVNTPPTIDDVLDITSCGAFTIPILEGVTYYNGANATGGSITSVTATQTVYAYKAGATVDCFAEDSFTVTIYEIPEFAEIADVTSCGTYNLPALPGVTYYNGTGTSGGIITSVTATQPVYAHLAGAIPECSVQQLFNVIINTAPVLGAIDDVTSCGSYNLPAMQGVTYYNTAGAQGAAITSVAATQQVFAYMAGATADCSTEQSFMVTITAAPQLPEFMDIISCGSYDLPVVQGVTYYNGPGATGGAITSVPATKTVYANMDGATADCSAEQAFTVTVSDAPLLEISGGCDGNDYILDVAVLNDDAQLDYTYEWTTVGGSILSGEDGPSVKVSGEGTYSVTITATQPVCNGQAQTVVGHANCMIQKGISVNGDGKNEFFDLEGFGVSKLEIFNRYGMKVYELSPYTNQWHGQSDKGEELPDGTYYYVIGFDNGDPVRTGWIYLNRKN